MSVSTSVYNLMRVHVGLTALVGQRIFPYAVPENEPLPAVAFSVLSEGVPDLDGVVRIIQSRVIVACYAPKILSAESVADQVIACFAAANVPFAARDGAFNADIGVHTETVEFDWWSY